MLRSKKHVLSVIIQNYTFTPCNCEVWMKVQQCFMNARRVDLSLHKTTSLKGLALMLWEGVIFGVNYCTFDVNRGGETSEQIILLLTKLEVK